MYTLYYSQGACSLATQIVLLELDQKPILIDVNKIDNFNNINPVGTVPVLVDNTEILSEGAAIILYLLDKHQNSMLPSIGNTRTNAIQDIMFANATMHPAYSKLFFLDKSIINEEEKINSLNIAAKQINFLWKVVENKLSKQPFLGGENYSAADIMLTVYSTWGDFFPVDIVHGKQTEKMLAAIRSLPSFINATNAEKVKSNSYLSKENS